MNSTERMLKLNRFLNENNHVEMVNEARAPKNSIYGLVGGPLMNQLLSILKKTVPSKYVKFENVETVGLGLWMISFDGFTRSDASFGGFISVSAPGGAIKTWTIDIDATDALKGKMKNSFEFGGYDDFTPTLNNVAKVMKQWVEI